MKQRCGTQLQLSTLELNLGLLLCDRKIIYNHITFYYKTKHDDILCNARRRNRALIYFLRIKYCILFNERTLNFSVGCV